MKASVRTQTEWDSNYSTIELAQARVALQQYSCVMGQGDEVDGSEQSPFQFRVLFPGMIKKENMRCRPGAFQHNVRGNWK